jgi:RNA methyltransferase, TrmH family
MTSSLSRADQRLIHALQRRKARETQGFFLAEGLRVVEELAQSNLDLQFAVVSSELEDSERGRALKTRLESRTRVQVESPPVLRDLAATENPQGVVAVARVPDTRLASIEVPDCSRVLVCDAVQDPGNLGTLIRVADAFAASAVLLLPGTVDPWNPKVVRAAAGSSFRVAMVAEQSELLIGWLREHGYRVLGADTAGDVIDQRLQSRVALMVGNEGAGLRSETRRFVDWLVRVDMPGHAESLNVAVAAGILMHTIAHAQE